MVQENVFTHVLGFVENVIFVYFFLPERTSKKKDKKSEKAGWPKPRATGLGSAKVVLSHLLLVSVSLLLPSS